MKKITFLVACFVATTSFMNAQSTRTLADMPNTANNPERTVQLPAAYFNNPATTQGENAGVASDGQRDTNVTVPFTGTYYNNLAPNAILYDNGPYWNTPGTPNVSLLETSLGMNTLGSGAQFTAGNSVADDVVFTDDVEITSIDVFAYQTGSSAPSINAIYLQVWDGDPSSPSSSIVWGNLTDDIFEDAVYADANRASETSPGDTSRQIQRVTANTTGLTLTAGTYWIHYTLAGSGSSGPWTPPIAILGQTTTGNALQNQNGVWVALEDSGTFTPQGLPFVMYGEVIGGTGNACDEENPNDFTFVNGTNCSSASAFKTANDVTVAPGEKFTLTNITASIFANGGITNVDVFYYDDAAGLPGNQIGSEASVTIDNQTVIGNNFGFDVNEIELTVAPFVFQGQAAVPTTYWIELSVTDGSASGSVFWVVTTSSMIGNPTGLFDGFWQVFDPTYDGVYIWEGECDALGVADNSLAGFNYYPNPANEVMHLSAAKNIESVTVYNLLGQKVMATIIGAISSDLNLSGLAAGTYMMKVTVEGQTGTYKIIKN